MRVALNFLLLLAACSDSSNVLEDLPNSSIAGTPREAMPETRIEAGLSRPVTIGEDGPRLDACGAMGRVVRVGGGGLAIRAAPFADARETGRMAEDDRAWICTRSLDQKWLGIVVEPSADHQADNGAVPDCGVSQPVDRKRHYDGPCESGWVSSASIRLIAG